MSLRDKAFRAVRWTTATTLGRVLLQLSQLAVLTRMLSPADYGLIAAVSATLAFAAHFTDFGLNSALVQRQHVTEDQRNSLFWVTLALAMAVTLLVAALAPLVAWAVGDERLSGLIALSSLAMVINAIGSQLRVNAEKALEFRSVAVIELVSTALGVAVSLVLARQGFGAYALVLGTLAGAASSSGMAWLMLSEGWRPHLQCRWTDVRPFLRFGGHMVANNVVNQINAVADVFIGSRLLGPAQMGLFTVPRSLTLQVQDAINPVITRVGFPLIAQVQHDQAQVARIYAQTLRMASSFSAPVYFYLFGFAPEVIGLLLGAAWHGSADVFRVLLLWGAVRSTGNPVGSLLFGLGRADLALRWNVALLCLVPTALWIGSGYGVLGLAVALLALQVGLFVPGWRFLVRPVCDLRLAAYADAALRPMAMAMVACLSAHFAASPIADPLLRCVAGGTMFGAIYVSASAIWNREWLGATLRLMRLSDAAARVDPRPSKASADVGS